MGTGRSASPDRSSPPSPGPIRPFHLPAVRSGRLPNGLELRSMARSDIPLVSLALVLDAGETSVPPGREGVAVLAGDALQGGTAQRSGIELAEALERLGSGLRVSTGWDATSVTFTCMAERLDEMLSLLSEVVREPTFPPEEVDRVRQQHLAELRRRRMEPARLADDELKREVFSAKHPYHRPLLGSPESVESLDERSVMFFADERYGPRGGGIVAVGDLSPEQVAELADRHFGGWSGPPSPEEGPPALPERGERSVVVVHRPEAVQSELRIGHVGPPRGTPLEDPLRVANSVLGGAFTSRLNLRLREERGFTYGVRSRLSLRRNGGAFSIGTSVETEVTGAALREAMDVFERFAEEGPTDEELSQARDYLAGVFPLRMETTGQLAARLAELIVFDLPDDHHHGYRERVREVDLARAREAVRTHLDPGRAVVLIVGAADRVLPELESLRLGEVEVRDS